MTTVLEERISNLMVARGIKTRRELAAKIGYSEQSLSMLLHGKYRPAAGKIASIAHVLGIPVTDLCTLLQITNLQKIKIANEKYERIYSGGLMEETLHPLYGVLCREIAFQYHNLPSEKRPDFVFSIARTMGNYNKEYSFAMHSYLIKNLADILKENMVPINENQTSEITGIGAALITLKEKISEKDLAPTLQSTYQSLVTQLHAVFETRENAMEKIAVIDKLELLLTRYCQK